MALPVDVRDLIRHGSQVQKDRELPVRLVVVVEADAPQILFDGMRDALRPRTVTARLQVEAAEPGVVLEMDPSVDAVVAIAGSGRAGLYDALDDARRRSIPVVVAGLGTLPVVLADALRHPLDDVVADGGLDHVLEDTARWLADRVPGKRLALATNFPFVRSVVARDAVKATALQNALIGGVTIFPGTDMPLMTANQAKMLLQIAAAYGQRLGPERVTELAAVVGGAFVFRAVARQLLTLVPGFGWAVKAGVGYTGTIAMGEAAITYFEHDADLMDVAAWVVAEGQSATERVVEVARERTGRSALPEAGSPDDPGEQLPARGSAGD